MKPWLRRCSKGALALVDILPGATINLTASHNPPEYNDIKFSTHDGAPALPRVTKQIESSMGQIVVTVGKVTCGGPPDSGFETADVKPAFLGRLAELVDLKAIARLGTRVVYEEFWGDGRGYPSDLLRDSSVKVETFHDYRDVLCGGHAPEPYDPACTVRSKYQALRIADDLFLGTVPPRVGPECIL